MNKTVFNVHKRDGFIRSIHNPDFLYTFIIVSSNVTIGSTNSIIMKAFLIRFVKTSFHSAHIDNKYF